MYPLFLLSIILLILFSKNNYSIQTSLCNVLFLPGRGIIGDENLNGPGWSLSTEYFTNILWAVLSFVFGKYKKYLFFVIFLIFILLLKKNFGYGNDVVYNKIYFNNQQFFSGGFARTICEFIFGIFLYSFYINNKLKISRLIKNKIQFLFLIILLLSLYFFNNYLYRIGFGYLIVYCFFPFLILSVLRKGTIINNFLKIRCLNFLGFTSYSMYVLHLPFSILFFDFISEVFKGEIIPAYATYFVFLLVISYLSEKFFVRPINSLSKKILNFIPSN